MILLWGLSGDDPLARVAQALSRLGADFVFLDQRDAPDTEVEIEFDPVAKGIWRGQIRTPSQKIDLQHVGAAYLRAYDSRALPAVAEAGEESRIWQHAVAVEAALTAWVETTRAVVLNKPSAM